MPGALPAGAQPVMPPPLTDERGNPLDEERVSEAPIGWPVIGVISRASGKLSKDTFKIYKGHEEVSQWQFQVFERGIEMPQAPGTPAGPTGPVSLGPGFGGKGAFGMPGGGGRPNTRWNQGFGPPGMNPWGAGGGMGQGPVGVRGGRPGGFGGPGGGQPWSPGMPPPQPTPQNQR